VPVTVLSLLLVVVGLVIVYLILLFHSCRNTAQKFDLMAAC